MNASETFAYREDDPSGLNTLQAISKADRFNRWMSAEVEPWMQGDILEIGSGIGNISGRFLELGRKITLSDIRAPYCDHLRKRFPQLAAERVLSMNLVDPEFRQKFAHLEGRFDSVFALNVIEHIEDDGLALRNIQFLLKSRGTFLMLVPAHPGLYNRLDRFLQHFRRYTEAAARQLFPANGFSVVHSWYFNSLGIPAWIWGGLTGRSGEITGKQMEWYDKLVPLVRFMDKALGRRVGLSVIVAGTKL